MATLVNLTIDALHAYLNAEYDVDPPPDIGEVTFHKGRWLDSPEEVSPLVTIHENNQQDTGGPGSEDWPHERITSGEDYFPEMAGGGCTYQMYYRYTIQLQYFMTLTGEEQQEALVKNREFVTWLINKISKADLAALRQFGLGPDDYGNQPLRIRLMKWNSREGGGPPSSYIERTVFFLEQLAQHTG